MWKLLGCVFAVVALIAIAGFTGILFKMWPSFWPDGPANSGNIQIEQLKNLRDAPKFGSMNGIPGARNEAVRLEQEAQVNQTLDLLIEKAAAHPKKSYILGVMKNALSDAQAFDSEEKDQLLEYFTQVLQILEIDSSNELFDVWRYGFPYGWVTQGKF